MLFNSLDFLVFFPIVTLLFFLLPHRFRWAHLLAASCYFYMSFVPAYILILFFIIIVDYIAALYIQTASGRRRKLLLTASIAANLGVLGVFKYYNFFIEESNALFHAMGYSSMNLPYLDIILPIGLSFHTFQAMSYTIEVYRGRYTAERNLGIYSLYVLFYPQLLAGPIERPQGLIHQFYEVKKFDSDRIIVGLKIMLWGFFKKIVIADRLAIYVNEVYGNVEGAGSLNLLLVVLVFFPFQIYCDFSGYTSIALGAAKVMGYNLTDNFRTPFLSVTVTEFWTRWHISLNNWFRDYLYRPVSLKLKHWGRTSVIVGLMLTFLLCGLWHGAGWNYITFGALQGLFITVELLLGVKAVRQRKTLFGKIFGIVRTYTLIAVTLIFFRAVDFTQAIQVIKKLSWGFDFRFTTVPGFYKFSFLLSYCFIILIVLYEKFYESNRIKQSQPLWREVILSIFLIICLIVLGVYNLTPFIYFQF